MTVQSKCEVCGNLLNNYEDRADGYNYQYFCPDMFFQGINYVYVCPKCKTQYRFEFTFRKRVNIGKKEFVCQDVVGHPESCGKFFLHVFQSEGWWSLEIPDRGRYRDHLREVDCSRRVVNDVS